MRAFAIAALLCLAVPVTGLAAPAPAQITSSVLAKTRKVHKPKKPKAPKGHKAAHQTHKRVRQMRG